MTLLDDSMLVIVFGTFAVGLFYFLKVAIFDENKNNKDSKK